MSKLINNVANFLRLIDEKGQLSLTNIAVYIVLFKVATTQDVNILDAGALFVALLNYSGKKVLGYVKEKKQALNDDEAKQIKQKLQDLNDKIGAVQAAQGFRTK